MAPEHALSQILRPWFKTYTTADINPEGVDMVVDLTSAGNIPDASYDVIYASHVLEHIAADELALERDRPNAQTRRICRPSCPIGGR